MKRLIACAVLAVTLGLSAWAAAPATNNAAKKVADTLTVDSAFDADAWELLDTVVVVKTDTCFTLYTISGVAEMDPADKLYIGFGDGYAGDSAAVDTFLYKGGYKQYGKVRVAFTATYLDSLISQTDANDTIYFRAAVGGSSHSEKVMLYDVITSAQVLDYSAAGALR